MIRNKHFLWIFGQIFMLLATNANAEVLNVKAEKLPQYPIFVDSFEPEQAENLMQPMALRSPDNDSADAADSSEDVNKEAGMVYLRDGSFYRVYFLETPTSDSVSFYLVGDEIDNKVSVPVEALLITATDAGEVNEYHIRNINIPAPKDSSEIESMLNYRLGYFHAMVYYPDNQPPTSLAALTTPIGALIFKLVAASTGVKQKNLGYPAVFLYNDMDYRKGYNAGAKQIRNRSYTLSLIYSFAVTLFIFAL